ncbi:MAG: transglycosylase SLT domain-containing protein [Phaeovulum sp.]|uniref:transglycosylase SLT domain-containing protein n=1 Tax=Phaeovulum sp. TaxID=2934796 RepID=UPI002735C0E6|nr:transglycosylase SLT domain-containing protein [Phaeovulum sp.]MDP3863061.1 transglycosylase SLT domain-containing protein [Phaeovulum sp.]
MPRILAMLVCAILFAAQPSSAELSNNQICEQVTQIAARQSGVPLDVMRAISLTETGRTIAGAFRAWPWAVNMEGDDAWFDTRDEATAFALAAYDRGARSFDVGCFQINYRWHGQHFSSIEQMFDPLINAQYAARLLTELYSETGSWGKAAGAYHSRTPEYANRYTERFERILAGLTGATPPPPPRVATDIPEIPDIVLAAYGPAAPLAPRVNRFPLLRAGSAGGLGSLVPLGQANSGTGLLTAAAAAMVE